MSKFPVCNWWGIFSRNMFQPESYSQNSDFALAISVNSPEIWQNNLQYLWARRMSLLNNKHKSFQILVSESKRTLTQEVAPWISYKHAARPSARVSLSPCVRPWVSVDLACAW